MLNFRQGLKLSSSIAFDPIPFLNMIFLVCLFYMLSSYFTRPVPVSVRLPRAVTSDIVQDKISVVITSENIIYCNDQVTTLRELREILSRQENQGRPIFIKADRGASVGRIADVWDLGRNLGIKRIDVATD